MASKWALSKREVDFVHHKYGDNDEKIKEGLEKEGDVENDQFDLRISEWLKNGKPMKEVDSESGYDSSECFGLGFDSKDLTCKRCGIYEACKEAYSFFVDSTEKEIFGMSKMNVIKEDEVEDDKIFDKIRDMKVKVEKNDSGVIKIHTKPKITIHTLKRDSEGKINVYSSKGMLPYVNRWDETRESCKSYKQSRIGFKILLSDLVGFIENMLFDPESE